MSVVRVSSSKNYDVIIESGIFKSAGKYVRSVCGGNTAVVVTDDIVGGFYGTRLTEALAGVGFRIVEFLIQNGESSKNMKNYIALLNLMAESGVTRADVVVALGGGVVGDLAGFAAATYMRGVPFVQIPTTLLAAVDSSVGGKTAVDLDAGKNLAGAFYQPDIVLCDYSLLETLPPPVFAGGCAEVIKYGMLADSALFYMLGGTIQERLEEIITRCVTIKRDIVGEDELETGVRKLLNFGHTVGHAVEKLSNYAVSHGEAVAAGMAVVTRASERMGLCGGECYSELVKTLQANGLPFTTSYSASELCRAALADKKRRGGTLTLIVPERVGKCVMRDIAVNELERFIALGDRG